MFLVPQGRVGRAGGTGDSEHGDNGDKSSKSESTAISSLSQGSCNIQPVAPERSQWWGGPNARACVEQRVIPHHPKAGRHTRQLPPLAPIGSDVLQHRCDPNNAL